jgi:hypothetical protein
MAKFAILLCLSGFWRHQADKVTIESTPQLLEVPQ